jgi:glycine cleavage system H protein
MYPANYRYTKEHEWVALDGEVATVGITHHAQEQLGDIVFVEAPRVGGRVEAGKPAGTVESVKAVSDIFSPVSGEVTEVNAALNDSPQWVNEDPHGKGWMFKVKLSGAAPSDLMADLMTAEQYDQYAREESHS